MIDVFGLPIIGMISLGLILYTLVAKIKLPKNFPGVFAAIFIGTALYYILAPMGLVGGSFTAPAMQLHFGLPIPTLGFINGFTEALKYLPIALPFAILTIVGGINVTESAKVAGDDYNTRNILLTEACSTLIAGVCGGVAQTTPYIGQPAYKAMGSRAGYTVLTGLFVGLGGMLGYVSFFVELIPRAVLAPILIFVALEIIVQAFKAVPPAHTTAVAFSLFPNVARLLQIKLSNTDFIPLDKFNELMTLPGKVLPEMLVTVALGNGFILTAMLWGAFVDLVIMAGLTFFGIIHSVFPNGDSYFPWNLHGVLRQVPYQFATAYLVLAAMFFVLSYTKQSVETTTI
jgi:AGZA family xanthine/uracil permease-like MFS transporter